MRGRTLFGASLLVATLVTVGKASASAPTLLGKVDCPWGSADCNRCVADVVDSMNRLRSHGDILGFHMNGAEDVTVSHHWQGIQRLANSGAPFFAISRSVSCSVAMRSRIPAMREQRCALTARRSGDVHAPTSQTSTRYSLLHAYEICSGDCHAEALDGSRGGGDRHGRLRAAGG